jgi:hypothetical protein
MLATLPKHQEILRSNNKVSDDDYSKKNSIFLFLFFSLVVPEIFIGGNILKTRVPAQLQPLKFAFRNNE